MLLTLKVQDFAIIDQLKVDFKEGLNILSGETGAGKSILLKSLSLLMGHKGSPSDVKTGKDQALIEGVFDIADRPDVTKQLAELGLHDADGTLIIRRMISSQGKSRIYVNDSLITLSSLEKLVCPLLEVTGHPAPLIEVTGQHENKSLTERLSQIDLVDQFAGTLGLRFEYQTVYEKIRTLQEVLLELSENQQFRAQRLDFLVFQAEEIKKLNLQEGEEETFESNYRKQKNVQKISEGLQSVQNLFEEGNFASALKKAESQLLELKRFDDQLEPFIERIDQLVLLITDFENDLSSHSKNLTVDTETLEAMESQMAVLRSLQRKYGQNLSDIVAHLQHLNTEIDDINSSESRALETEKEIKKQNLVLKQLGSSLSTKRTAQLKNLEKRVNEELKNLNMKGVMFHIECRALSEPSTLGYEEIEFMIQASPKDPLRPMAKIASGGELSRILLALKSVLGDREVPRTYLFDEVDTGVSGETAEKVGRKLRQIAERGQVICVTHLPQVASFGHRHFLIEKKPAKAGISMSIQLLDKESRIQELARLISGEKISKTSLQHAKTLLQEST